MDRSYDSYFKEQRNYNLLSKLSQDVVAAKARPSKSQTLPNISISHHFAASRIFFADWRSSSTVWPSSCWRDSHWVAFISIISHSAFLSAYFSDSSDSARTVAHTSPDYTPATTAKPTVNYNDAVFAGFISSTKQFYVYDCLVLCSLFDLFDRGQTITQPF